MSFHIDSLAHDYVRAGMSAAEARRATLTQFGNVLRHKEAGHDVRTNHLDQVARDLKSGLRQLINAKGFAFVAIVTLALGIGLNAAVFAVVKSSLLDSLPYADADRLVRIHGSPAGSLAGGPLSAGTVNDSASGSGRSAASRPSSTPRSKPSTAATLDRRSRP